jgi:rSAM/selenodomain-associated transferase 1
LVKYPERGKVKTRLAEHVDVTITTELYSNFVLDVLATLGKSRLKMIVCFHPTGAFRRFQRWLGTEYEYMPQRGANHGDRLLNSFVDAFSRGFESAIAIASDVPDLPGNILLEASRALQSCDAVIGPSPDGGYYLIGFKRVSFLPGAFQEIEWSTDLVSKQTISKLNEGGCSCHVLPSWVDIDTISELRSLLEERSHPDFNSSNTMRYLLKHKEAITQGDISSDEQKVLQ